MNYKWIIFLDEFIGGLLLRVIFLLPPFAKDIPRNAAFKNILVMKFWGMGTILETTPFFCALKQKYPDIPLDILTFSDNRQMVENLGLFSNVHTVDLRKGIFNLFFQTIRFILAHRKKYSLVIDLEFFSNYSALVVKLFGSRYSLGFEGFFNIRNHCYSRLVTFDHSNHVRVIFLKFLDALYIKRPTDIALSAPKIPDEKKTRVLGRFPTLKDDDIKITVNIISSELCTNRRWPEENFRKLIGFIQRDYKRPQIYLVGGRRDLPAVRSFYESLPDKRAVYVTAGEMDILEFSYVLSRTDLLISSDSGPLHIAEALKIPVVCFFGPETPSLYGPMSDNSLVFYENLFCSPCLNTHNHKRTRCRDNQCLKIISPEDVYEKMKIRYFQNKIEKC